VSQSVSAKAPKVSVCVVTYNHERFIETCLRSLLIQVTDFDFEIIVSDDCSSDGTGAILDRLARVHPDRLRVSRHSVNRGPTQTFLATHNLARGEYVASLDGDDFAHPGKLAMQVKLLDDHPDLVACGHRMQIVDEAGQPTGRSFPAHLAARFDIGKAIRCGMPTFASSIMYRKQARTLLSADFELFDWYILTDLLMRGDAGYVPEILGSYRINSTSLTSTLAQAGMRARMLEMYARRFDDLPCRRADFFAYAVRAAAVCARLGIPVTAAHRQFLRATFTLGGAGQLLDALTWIFQNRAALAR